VAGMLLLTGCSTSQPQDTGSPSVRSSVPSTTATSRSETIDTRVQPAVDAYVAFTTASNNASRNPLPFNSSYPPGADYKKFSFDPMRVQNDTYLANLASQKISFRGTPPTPRVHVTSVQLDAKPYPTVMLADCQTTDSDWQAYDQAGHQLPAAPASAPPPYLISAKMIYYKGHWGLQETTADTSHTCTG